MAAIKELNVERYAALAISIATIGTAWCAFQASVWGGRQTFELAAANAANREAIFAHIEANQERLVDAQLFLGLAKAHYTGDEQSLQFYLSRFPGIAREELEETLSETITRKDLSLGRFRDPTTVREEGLEAHYLRMAHRNHDAAAQANHRSDLYIFITVLFASSLFFAGMSTKFEYESIQRYFLLVGTLLVVVGIVVIVRLPVAF